MHHFAKTACLFSALLILPLAAEAAPQIITVAADKWCPINCDADGTEQGVGIDLAKRAFRGSGYKIKYIVMPWDEALREVRKGTVDAVVGANVADDPKLIFPENPIYKITDDFYVRAGNGWRFDGIESLAGKKIGVIKDYGYGELVQHYIKQHRSEPEIVYEATGDDALAQNIQKLIAGDIDVVVESKAVMDYRLKALGRQDELKQVGSLPQGYIFVAFSPALAESKDRARLFDEGVEKLKGQGALDALYGAYGMRASF